MNVLGLQTQARLTRQTCVEDHAYEVDTSYLRPFPTIKGYLFKEV